MIAYLDSSVVLRILFGQPGRLAEWGEITRGVASGLLEVECLRTIDRLRLLGELTVESAVERREAVFRILESIELVELSAAGQNALDSRLAWRVARELRQWLRLSPSYRPTRPWPTSPRDNP